eukprot:6358388-Pyramimonas_sp.AAC.1
MQRGERARGSRHQSEELEETIIKTPQRGLEVGTLQTLQALGRHARRGSPTWTKICSGSCYTALRV